MALEIHDCDHTTSSFPCDWLQKPVYRQPASMTVPDTRHGPRLRLEGPQEVVEAAGFFEPTTDGTICPPHDCTSAVTADFSRRGSARPRRGMPRPYKARCRGGHARPEALEQIRRHGTSRRHLARRMTGFVLGVGDLVTGSVPPSQQPSHVSPSVFMVDAFLSFSTSPGSRP